MNTIKLGGLDAAPNNSYFCIKTYVVSTHWNCLTEAIPMSTHNICFATKIKIILKYISVYIALSTTQKAMQYYYYGIQMTTNIRSI